MPARTGPPETAGRWCAAARARDRPDPPRARRGRAAARAARRGHPRRGRERARAGRVRRASTRCSRRSRTPAAAAAATSSSGLGAAQFGTAGAVDRLRTLHARSARDRRDKPDAVALAATDPANPYGAALPWPDARRPSRSGHRPGRKAGALVVLVDGALALYVERGGRTLLTWSDDADRARARPPPSLAEAARRGALGRLTVEKADGEQLLGGGSTPLREALDAAGFVATPRGLRLRLDVPEGDTVWRAARQLDRALTGQALTAHRLPGARAAPPSTSPARTVIETVSRGKHLLTRIDARRALDAAHPPQDGGRLARATEPGERWRRPAHTGPGRAATPTTRTAVGFALGIVELVARDREDDVVGHLGPDLLGPDWDAGEAAAPARAPTRPARSARRCSTRRNLAGIGNMYAAELCFLSGVAPADPGRRRARPAPAGRAAPTRCSSVNKRPRRCSPPPATCARGEQHLGLPARPAAVPPLRHPDPRRAAGTRGPGAGDVLVPHLPALTMTP